MATFKITFMTAVMISPALAGSWYGEAQKGWLWYKKTPQPVIAKAIEEKPSYSKKSSPKSSPGRETTQALPNYRDRLKQVQQHFEELQARAVINPTLDNVQAMQQAQNAFISRSTEFEKMWMLASLLSPENYRPEDQPYPHQRKLYRQHEQQQLTQKIKALAQRFGLFFVFKQDCPYCHQFAPVVRELVDTYGFDYKAISADGSALPEFPDAVADNGTIALINRDGIYPALFLVNPQSQQVIPLARGLVNSEALRDNFKTIIQSLEGATHGR